MEEMDALEPCFSDTAVALSVRLLSARSSKKFQQIGFGIDMTAPIKLGAKQKNKDATGKGW